MSDLLLAYRMRWKRRRLLFRAFRKRRQLDPVEDRTGAIRADEILVLSTIRNEAARLPYFLDYYRKLGVSHFLIVDNASDDGSADYLSAQPDVSVWSTAASYKLSRFGMDWLTGLLAKYGHGHWCLTVDADELLIYPSVERMPLYELTIRLEQSGREAFGAMMLDLYPKGRLGAEKYHPSQNPLDILQWFDAGNYQFKYQDDLQNLLIRGGVRSRVFFGQEPARAPTLSKTPLVRWDRRFAYVSSTHSLLPRRLNQVRSEAPPHPASGVLLHTKFLDVVIAKSEEDRARQQHFENGALFRAYYDALIENPCLWNEESLLFEGWQQLEELGLMSRGDWK